MIECIARDRVIHMRLEGALGHRLRVALPPGALKAALALILPGVRLPVRVLGINFGDSGAIALLVFGRRVCVDDAVVLQHATV
jgi:hypothetical protein